MSSSAGLSPPLAWRDGEKDFVRIDWKHGTVFPPCDRKFHQHFNASKQPAHYLATGVGGLRYPLTLGQPRSWPQRSPDNQLGHCQSRRGQPDCPQPWVYLFDQ